MRGIVVVIFASFLTPLLLGTIFNDHAPAQKDKGSFKFEAKGKIVAHTSVDLRKLGTPIMHHPGIMPPARDGHVWRWHSGYGRWFSFASVGAPTEIVLPATYALPAKVDVFEVESSGGCICPYCGHHLEIR